MAQYDLTNKIGRYLDRHMIFPLLEFLSHHEVYIKILNVHEEISLLIKSYYIIYI